MIYKKQFHQLPYDTKKRIILRFLFLFFLEISVNKLFALYGLSISILPFCWLIFVKKYFNFHIGLGLFSIGFVSYFCFCHFAFFQLLSTAIVMFYVAHLTDIDKISACLAFLVQNLLFVFFDPNFNSKTFIRSFLLSLVCIVIAKLNPVPSDAHRHETVFS
ncbi:MAG: hypothetical protein LBH08_03525 [Puniceicoccales bacterium]|nr:hypothetical protein [Puniceicoccales bacterium]